MKLLIVDDQFSAAQGIAKKIDWEGIGIDEVCAAQNAMEARLLFAPRVPDIMLCDIEMPVENGVEFCRWVKDKKYDTQIIFLTCHADFRYAQEAIKLSAVDYIVQPASYEKIRDTVRKATLKIHSKDAVAIKIAEAEKEKGELQTAVWSRFLRGDSTINIKTALAEFDYHNDNNFIVLFQIVCWKSVQEYWQGNLMCTALNNFVDEMLSPENCVTRVMYINRNIYAVVIQGKEPCELSLGLLEQKFAYLCSIYKVYMPCTVACYIEGRTKISQLPAAWEQLIRRKAENVTLHAGVFAKQSCEEAVPEDIEKWEELLQGYSPQGLISDTSAYIDKLTTQERMTDVMLRRLYYAFVKFLYNAGNYGNVMEQVFESKSATELYLNAARSVDEMKLFIEYSASLFIERDIGESTEHSTIQCVKEYIEKNLTEDIRIEDVASIVHLSADYVTRLFKKEEGCSIKTYIIQRKMMEANNLLRSTSMPISAVAARLGYCNFSHFSTAYKKVMGYPPSDNRERIT